jgi:hypothetical protein
MSSFQPCRDMLKTGSYRVHIPAGDFDHDYSVRFLVIDMRKVQVVKCQTKNVFDQMERTR